MRRRLPGLAPSGTEHPAPAIGDWALAAHVMKWERQPRQQELVCWPWQDWKQESALHGGTTEISKGKGPFVS